MNLHDYGYHLVDGYNATRGTNLSVRTFFTDVAAPLLFGDEGDSIFISNSPFFQKKSIQKLEGRERLEAAMDDLVEKVDAGLYHMSVFPGGPTKDTEQATASCATDVDFRLTPDDIYAAWLGYACGLMVEGGLLIFDKAACLPVFEGWKAYRRFVNSTPKMKWKQLGVWNAYWAIDRPDGGKPPTLEQHSTATTKLQTAPWGKALLGLARLSPETRALYVTRFGKTNTTIGHLPFGAADLRSLADLYQSLIASEVSPFTFQSAMKTKHSLWRAATFGQLGLEALRPEKLGQSDDIPFQKAWLILMLDSKTMQKTAKKAAQRLAEYEKGAKRAKTDRKNKVKALFEASTQTQFATALKAIVDDEPDPAYAELMDEAMEMPDKKFKLFTTLIAIYHKAS